MVGRDYVHEARIRVKRRKRLGMVRRITHWLVPSLPVLILLASIAVVIVANVRITAIP